MCKTGTCSYFINKEIRRIHFKVFHHRMAFDTEKIKTEKSELKNLIFASFRPFYLMIPVGDGYHESPC
ncbi:hypothetical protein DAI22_04g101600 [Oryza sativa Japonica Group]|nr:hypothetical protein DAI22_04g101600 [Oryza sativa Japonica Group]